MFEPIIEKAEAANLGGPKLMAGFREKLQTHLNTLVIKANTQKKIESRSAIA